MSDTTILQNSTHVIKPKKSVALSGVPAAIRRSAPWVKAATTCITVATIFVIRRNIVNLKKWRTC
ncbi:hypothetical protein ACNKHM_05600 [Shigella sonnei]